MDIANEEMQRLNNLVNANMLIGESKGDAFKRLLGQIEQSLSKSPCSDGLSCPWMDDCRAIEERIHEKQILSEALKEIYNIRGEDKDIEKIVNKALYRAMAT